MKVGQPRPDANICQQGGASTAALGRFDVKFCQSLDGALARHRSVGIHLDITDMGSSRRQCRGWLALRFTIVAQSGCAIMPKYAATYALPVRIPVCGSARAGLNQ